MISSHSSINKISIDVQRENFSAKRISSWSRVGKSVQIGRRSRDITFWTIGERLLPYNNSTKLTEKINQNVVLKLFQHVEMFPRIFNLEFVFFSGVQFDVRKLQLGDFLWVARERTFPTPGTVLCVIHSIIYFILIFRTFSWENSRNLLLCGHKSTEKINTVFA